MCSSHAVGDVQVATPAELRVCEPPVHWIGAALALNATLPVGVPLPEALRDTVAV